MYYDLAEDVYQAIDHDCHAPVLALQRIREKSTNFMFTTELDVFKEDTRLAEVDLLALCDGRIVIGEAKTTDKIAATATKERKKLGRLVEVARAVTAQVVVLATTETAWRQETRSVAEELSRGERAELRFIEALLPRQPPGPENGV